MSPTSDSCLKHRQPVQRPLHRRFRRQEPALRRGKWVSRRENTLPNPVREGGPGFESRTAHQSSHVLAAAPSPLVPLYGSITSPQGAQLSFSRRPALGKPLTYIGSEQGVKVPIGKELTQKLGRNIHHGVVLPDAPCRSQGNTVAGRQPAFDDLGLFYAVEGGVGEYFRLVRGRVQVNEKGANTWVADEKGTKPT